jgi:quercetin dioxygenase-like cupin family protein
MTELASEVPPFVPENAHFMTVTIDVPPGDAGTPPHRHSGPVFGYVLDGELIFELEGEPERIITAGQAFWEPGGDVIHYQAGNNSDDVPVRFVAVMVCAPGVPMLTMVEPEELEARRSRRAPRPANARF